MPDAMNGFSWIRPELMYHLLSRRDMRYAMDRFLATEQWGKLRWFR